MSMTSKAGDNSIFASCARSGCIEKEASSNCVRLTDLTEVDVLRRSASTNCVRLTNLRCSS